VHSRADYGQYFVQYEGGGLVHLLEIVQALLPSSVALYPDLDTTEYYFLSSFEINAQLNNVAVINRIWSALLSRTTKPYMIEERARTTLDVLD
jgi:hypothetical protein